MFSILYIIALFLFSSLVFASPLTHQTRAIPVRRTDPIFPPSPPSCPICAQSYSSISSCAQAAPVFANFTEIIFDPAEFIDVIKCACTDTFQSAFPQCVDCFQQTNQTALLDPSGDDLPSVISGIRKVCALASTLLGNVSGANGEQANGTPSNVPVAVPGGAIALNPSSTPVMLLNVAMAIGVVFTGSITL